MWQKPDKNPTTKYHYIAESKEDSVTGACGLLMRKKPELQTDELHKIYSHLCNTCRQVTWILHTSITDAQNTLRDVHDVKTVQSALKLAHKEKRGVTMIRILEAKIRKLEKAGK